MYDWVHPLWLDVDFWREMERLAEQDRQASKKHYAAIKAKNGHKEHSES